VTQAWRNGAFYEYNSLCSVKLDIDGLVLLFKDDRTEDLIEFIYERMLLPYTKLQFHCPKIFIPVLSLLYVVASS